MNIAFYSDNMYNICGYNVIYKVIKELDYELIGDFIESENKVVMENNNTLTLYHGSHGGIKGSIKPESKEIYNRRCYRT